MPEYHVNFVPELRPDFEARWFDDGGVVVWSPERPDPLPLDPVAAIMLDVIDGAASIGQIALEVHEEVGVDRETAWAQVQRIVTLFDQAGILTGSGAGTTAADEIRSRGLFVNPVNH